MKSPLPNERGGPPARVTAALSNSTRAKDSTSAVRFQPETLDALRHRLPDYLLAALGVELRRMGARLVGRCPNPSHDDSNPSFAVFGIHHETCGCHPCGFTGDVFDLAQWLGRATSFPEAVQDVAGTLGFYLPQATAGTATRPATPPPRPAKQRQGFERAR